MRDASTNTRVRALDAGTDADFVLNADQNDSADIVAQSIAASVGHEDGAIIHVQQPTLVEISTPTGVTGSLYLSGIGDDNSEIHFNQVGINQNFDTRWSNWLIETYTNNFIDKIHPFFNFIEVSVPDIPARSTTGYLPEGKYRLELQDGRAALLSKTITVNARVDRGSDIYPNSLDGLDSRIAVVETVTDGDRVRVDGHIGAVDSGDYVPVRAQADTLHVAVPKGTAALSLFAERGDTFEKRAGFTVENGGVSKTFDVEAGTTYAVAVELSSSLDLDGTAYELTIAGDGAVDEIAPSARSDLALNGVTVEGGRAVGKTATITATVTNTGPSTSSGNAAVDFAVGGTTHTAQLDGGLDAEGQTTVSVQHTWSAPAGERTVNATLRPGAQDRNPGNDVASATVTVAEGGGNTAPTASPDGIEGNAGETVTIAPAMLL